MDNDVSALMIYPTSLTLRQHQARALERESFLDGRGHLSLRMFMDACARAAQREGLLTADGARLTPLADLDRDLAIVFATTRFLEEADGQGVLGRLSSTALEEVLASLVAYVDPLAGRADGFLAALDEGGGKNAELAGLYRAYDKMLVSLGRASTSRINAAILSVLCRPRDQWPRFLRGFDRVAFAGLRWVPPFVETTAGALASGLGASNVRLEHILEEHEQEWWGESVMAQVGTLVFGGEEARDEWEPFHAAETSSGIASFLQGVNGLGELRDGFAMLDPALAEPARTHVCFSQSVGIYGEVEDLARRIAWLLRDRKCRPDQVCLTARNLGDYSDAITDVFSRFGIPYYFRRGIPAMSVASVKAVLGLSEFSAFRRRETFCSLLESPWFNWFDALGRGEHWIVRPGQLADDIRRSGVEPEIPSADILEHRLAAWYRAGRREDAADRAEAAVRAYKVACGPNNGVDSLAEKSAGILARCEALGVEKRLRAWANHRDAEDARGASAYVLNARSFSAVKEVLENLSSASIPGEGGPPTWPAAHAIITRCVRNLTVADPASTDSGVWVLTPYDLAGLRFEVVIAAGMNSGTFPSVPRQSALLHDHELEEIREKLGDPLPAAALLGSTAQGSQENLLFLSLMAAARGSLVLSRTCKDTDGRDIPPSVFYSTLWRLVGWPAFGDDLPETPPEAYDRWRLQQAPATSGEHWRAQADLEPHCRQPFPGESFLSSIPLALCCAADEARQSIALGQDSIPRDDVSGTSPIAERVRHALEVEQARCDFFDSLAKGEAATPEEGVAPLVGHLGQVQAGEVGRDAGENIVDFSTTALQNLANCPYRYYLERIMGLEALETNDLEASPMDRGSVLHAAMEIGFRILLGAYDIAEQKLAGIKAASRDALGGLPACRHVARERGTWILCPDPAPEGARPIAVLDPAHLADYQALFAKVCDLLQDQYDQGRSSWKLGAREQARVEWKTIRAGVRNLLAAQLRVKSDTYLKMLGIEGKDVVRGTVFVEYAFDSHENPRHPTDVPSAEFKDPETGSRLRVHGVIDRVDLLFDEHNGQLLGVMVLDYKGSSKNKTSPKLVEDIVAGHDCQLPVYGTVAAREFLVEGADPLPVICQYLLYHKDLKDGLTAMKNWWVGLDGRPVKQDILEDACGEHGSMMEKFQSRLFTALRILESGAFTVNPDSCDFCPYSGVCRYVEPTLEQEDE